MANRTAGRLLWKAAARAADHPFFLASQLLAYGSLRGLSRPDLAKWLGCKPNGLVRLELCRRPEVSAPSFRAEVEKVAAFAGAKPERVAEALREVEAIAALRQARHPKDGGMLLAARDRVEEVPPSLGRENPKKRGKQRRRSNR